MRKYSLIISAVLVGVLLFVYANMNKPAEKTITNVATAVEGKTTGKAQIGGAFTLTDQNGEKVSDTKFRGKYMLVFFGFTNCPAICPTELGVMTTALEKFSDAGKVAPVFITVDPERDTPERMKEFFKNFHPSFTALTGTKDEVEKVKSEYKVFSSKIKNEKDEGNYNMDHSSFIYLLDKEGNYITHFPSGGTAEILLAGLEKDVK